jgi:hypothetical protein
LAHLTGAEHLLQHASQQHVRHGQRLD